MALLVLLHADPVLAGAGRNQPNDGGGSLYHDYCSVCHGDRGDGQSRARNSLIPPPRDFTTPHAREQLTRERMIASVRDGRPGTAMVSWKTQLRAEQIEAVVDFIRTVFMQPAVDHTAGTRVRPPRPSGAAAMQAPMPRGLRGDAARGRAFYAGNCAACHGVNGDGNGPRAYFQNPRPRNFLEPQWKSTYNRPFLFAAIATGKLGTEMSAWSKVLDDQQIADVAEYVFQAYIHPPNALAPGATAR